VRGQGITLSHYSEAEIVPGRTWKSKRAVLGAAVGPEAGWRAACWNDLSDHNPLAEVSQRNSRSLLPLRPCDICLA